MCILFVLIIYICTGGIFMNQWETYGQTQSFYQQPVYQQPQNGCYMVPYNQEEENNKIIRQTALCCTVAVLIGVGVGIMIESNRNKREEDRVKSAFLLN